mmetsp:Transcript_9266/g.15103  ORF Transcript_9266/g.15103 Transcript_9266/m.15103 type:complete len:81 (-) Transcript_9266:393-635(-)
MPSPCSKKRTLAAIVGQTLALPSTATTDACLGGCANHLLPDHNNRHSPFIDGGGKVVNVESGFLKFNPPPVVVVTAEALQ